MRSNFFFGGLDVGERRGKEGDREGDIVEEEGEGNGIGGSARFMVLDVMYGQKRCFLQERSSKEQGTYSAQSYSQLGPFWRGELEGFRFFWTA